MHDRPTPQRWRAPRTSPLARLRVLQLLQPHSLHAAAGRPRRDEPRERGPDGEPRREPPP